MENPTLETLKYPIGRFECPETHNPAQRRSWMTAIQALPSWLDVCIENLDEIQFHTPYRPGGWTINQVIHHLADSHINAYTRLKLALTEANPTIKPYEEKLWAETPDVTGTPANVSITLLHALHRRWGATLQGLREEQWERTIHHPEHDRNIPVWEMTAMYAWHGRHHMEQIRSLRERSGW